MATITDLHFQPWNIELHAPFGIATGSQASAANVLVTLALSDGTVGLGEAAPFPAVNGETQSGTLAMLASLRAPLIGQPIQRWRELSPTLSALARAHKSALCAVEIALLDAYCRHTGQSVWAFAGARETSLKSDITIPTGSLEAAQLAANSAVSSGFDVLKIKVGGHSLEHDVTRVQSVITAAPAARVILDGNCGFSGEQAVNLVRAIAAKNIVLFEQPTARTDLAGMRLVREKCQLLVAADESAGNVIDLGKLKAAQACDVINIKLMKSGVVESLAMIDQARQLGFGLMVGGMVETELAMATSAALALGLGGFGWFDLDTPLFMRGEPTRGGVLRIGPQITLVPGLVGHGVSLPQ